MARIVGLTGGLASGKSFVSSIMAENGVYVNDADILARKVVRKGSRALKEISKVFGEHVLNEDGELNRGRLKKIVFNNTELLHRLNKIIHPRVIELQDTITKDILEKEPSAIVVIDAALLIEAGYHEKVDTLVVVYVEPEIQVKRLMERDGINREEALRLINLQMPLEEKVKLADYVINNSYSREKTRQQVIKLVQSWKQS